MTGLIILFFVIVPLSAFLLVKFGGSAFVKQLLGHDTKCPFCGSMDISESNVFAGIRKDSFDKTHNIHTLKYDCLSCNKHWEKEHIQDGEELLYKDIVMFEKWFKKKNKSNG